MPRLNYKQLEIIKEKFGVDKLWSYSKVSTYIQCHWLHKLKYIDKIKSNISDSCYTYFGTIAHDNIQGFYDKEHEYSDMINIFNDKVLQWQLEDNPQLRFPSDNERDNYIENLRHYFTNTEIVPFNVVNEQPVLAVFEGKEKYVFQGYIDSNYKDENGDLIIVDYKTSSISGFTGKKLIDKSKQLIIYAIGMNQFHKIPFNKMKIRYDMMKYLNISYKLKNGNTKVTKAERRLWVAHIANQIRKDLEDVSKQIEKLEKDIAKLQRKINMKKTTPEEAEGYSVEIGEIEREIKELQQYDFDTIQINDMLEESIGNNNLDNMPQFIKDKYKLSNCYIDIELTEDLINEIKSELVSVLNEIIEKSKEEDLEGAFNRPRIDNSESYYCTNLCDMRDQCIFFKEFKENSALFLDRKEEVSDDEILAMLGL